MGTGGGFTLDGRKEGKRVKSFLTTTEAGRLFGVSRQTVITWVSEGLVDGYRLPGGHWRVSAESLQRYVESLMVGKKEKRQPVYTMDKC